jgi:TRAP-type C4-dicarboxylate transport system permease small subunit
MEEQKIFNFCFNTLAAQRMKYLIYIILGLLVVSSYSNISKGNFTEFISEIIGFILTSLLFIYIFGPALRKTPLKYIEINEDIILINKSRFRFIPKVINKSEIESIKMTKHDTFITITCKNRKNIKINTKLIWLNDLKPLQKILSEMGHTDFEFIKDDSEFKNAPYYKRVLSLIIDAVFLYAIIAIIYYFYPQYYDFWFDISYLFLASIFLHYILYKKQGQTFGEKCIGIKLKFTQKVESKNINYLIKAFVMSIVYIPFFFYGMGTIIFIIGSLLIQLKPKIRSQKILLWDLLSQTVVIDLKK